MGRDRAPPRRPMTACPAVQPAAGPAQVPRPSSQGAAPLSSLLFSLLSLPRTLLTQAGSPPKVAVAPVAPAHVLAVAGGKRVVVRAVLRPPRRAGRAAIVGACTAVAAAACSPALPGPVRACRQR